MDENRKQQLKDRINQTVQKLSPAKLFQLSNYAEMLLDEPEKNESSDGGL